MQLKVSTTFFPSASLPGGLETVKPDLIIFTTYALDYKQGGKFDPLTRCTRDRTVFYCHRTVLSSRSSNDFGGLLSSTPGSATPSKYLLGIDVSSELNGTQESPSLLATIVVTESSAVFDLVLHIIYPRL